MRLASLVLVMLLAACAAATPSEPTPTPTSPQGSLEAPRASVDPLTAPLLQRYGLEPSGPTKTSTVRIGPLAEPPWNLYLGVSRRIDLDFAGLEGTNGEMRITPVLGNLGPQHECAGCSKGGRVHVLVVGGQMVGAWLSDEVTVPGIYALSEVGLWCRDDEC